MRHNMTIHAITAHAITTHIMPLAELAQARQRYPHIGLGERMRAVGKRLVAYRARHAQAHLTLYGLKVESLQQKGNFWHG
jgi:hypothetical protein